MASAANNGRRAEQAAVLAALREFPAGGLPSAIGLADALAVLESVADLRGLPPAWWIDFDQAVRTGSAWWTVRASETNDRLHALLPGGWQWAVSVCSRDGLKREAALLEDRLPHGHPALLPLLVVRCSDWAPPVRHRAEQRLARALADAAPGDLGLACATAWACQPRSRGAVAVRLTADRLPDAGPALWPALFAFPDHRTRRRALAEAPQHLAVSQDQFVALALTDPDVTVARGAAERILLQCVPPLDAPLTSSAEMVVRQLLLARIPQVRAAAVTVLRRGQRPDLAVPLLLDRSTLVRQTARWVVRSHGQDPAAQCRNLLARASADALAGAGAVQGLAECGDASDVPWFRVQLGSPRPKARAAALRALTSLAPLTTADLLALLEHDHSPSVGRAVVEALTATAHPLPHTRLRHWLAPTQRPELRRRAITLLRASDAWTRLATDLQLITDPDPDTARAAESDLRNWLSLASLGHRPPSPESSAAIESLLPAAEAVLDTRTLHQIRFRIPKQ
ncbi:HEAT repeat domain-containing protein [Streptacidiphilus sp. N1-10]|uniref:HEAT repeat domain-containing protein n=1 Tax=Streptacidiphilus jeojiensis TaxID=3229225 RepID=A0ABV6XY12_9ACTN